MRRNLKHQLKHGLRLALVAVPVLWLSLYALLSPSGYLALRRQQQLYQKESSRVQALEEQNRLLNQSVRALRSDPAAIEGIAREQLHLTKPGEIVYTYPMTPARGEEATANARVGMRPAR
ncbi:MAG TPA: septum formation initiator family protein [Terriglobales bacterium]|nr:septum formation initiator family protein [Terriglobales bacterium]